MTRRRRSVKRHRLLIYHQLGQRLRTAPFFTIVLCAVLLGLGWLGNREILTGGNREMLERIWSNRTLLYLVLGASTLLYGFMILIAQTSYVEAQAKTLRVKAGLIPVDISYGRIRQIRLAQFGLQYPADQLRGTERALAEDFAGSTCTIIDLNSLPRPFTPALLKRLWHRFMFTADSNSLMFVVKDAIVLNQQIDGYLAARQSRQKGENRYLDPIERAARMQRQRAAQTGRSRRPGAQSHRR